VHINGRSSPAFREIMSRGAQEFLAELGRRFECRRRELLRARVIRQSDLDDGWLPSFSSDTAWIRESPWKVRPVATDLVDRRVEIGGAVDRQSVIDALTSGANVFMADFEDGNSPTWDNGLRGQINLRDALAGTIGYEDKQGNYHALGQRTARLAIRPRGWHLVEPGFGVDQRPIAATIFDAGLFFFHNLQALVRKGHSPHVYIPKVESYFEARLWNDLLSAIERLLKVDVGTIRTTVLMETVLAAFQMDEILYELRERAAGLHFGRWDYLFSLVRKFRSRPEFVLPDRNECTMRHRALRAVLELMISTAHRRGVHAIGGKAARVPSFENRDTKHELFEQLMRDLRREASSGLDGTQVAHPRLVPLAKGIFETAVRGANQITSPDATSTVKAEDLLTVPRGPKTRAALRTNVNIVIRYLAAWLDGTGCVAVDGVVENMATAELARAQVWQWIAHSVMLDSGETVDADLVNAIIDEQLDLIEHAVSSHGTQDRPLPQAVHWARHLMTSGGFEDHLTNVVRP
jgi:malate synthase